MRHRRGRPGLLNTMARTAVITGTANATVNAMNHRQAGRRQAAATQQAAEQAAFQTQAQVADVQAELDALRAAPAPTPPPPPSAPAAPAAQGDDLMGQLQRLADMKAAGILDDAEFAAAKAKLLA